MSVYKKQSLTTTYPAFNVYTRETHYVTVPNPKDADATWDMIDGITEITEEDILILKTSKGHAGTFSAGSVASYAIRNNECPIKAINNAKEKGHPLVWINANGSVLTAHHREAETVIEVFVGMLVRFQGVIATIESANNNNLQFFPIVN